MLQLPPVSGPVGHASDREALKKIAADRQQPLQTRVEAHLKLSRAVRSEVSKLAPAHLEQAQLLILQTRGANPLRDGYESTKLRKATLEHSTVESRRLVEVQQRLGSTQKIRRQQQAALGLLKPSGGVSSSRRSVPARSTEAVQKAQHKVLGPVAFLQLGARVREAIAASGGSAAELTDLHHRLQAALAASPLEHGHLTDGEKKMIRTEVNLLNRQGDFVLRRLGDLKQRAES